MRALTDDGHVRHYGPSEVLLRQGDPGGFVLALMARLARVTRDGSQLGYPHRVPNRPAVIAYATAALSVDEETIRTAKESEQNRAKLDGWRLLKDHVLADPAMACVWWLADHPELLEKLPQMAPAFDRLAALGGTNDGRVNDLLRVRLRVAVASVAWLKSIYV